MNKILSITMTILVCIISSSSVAAQSCKPDSAYQDKLTKEQVVQWRQNLTEQGFLKSLISDSIYITASIGRFGSINAITVQIDDLTTGVTVASLAYRYYVTKGNRFIFGFTDGKPLSFIATDVSKEASQGGAHSVLSAHVSDAEMEKLRDILTKKQIDEIRIDFTNGPLQRSISKENGKKMMDKFSCYYQFLDKAGIILTAGNDGPDRLDKPLLPTQDYSASAPGKYLRIGKNKMGKNSDYLDLNSDGTFYCVQDGGNVRGTYKINAGVIILQLPNGPTDRGRINGNTITDSEGISWEKSSEPSNVPRAPVTVDQIIQMVTAKLSDDIIIKIIQDSNSKFDITPEILIKLKASGVSDVIIRAMTK
jgi:hypothetical protein